MLNLDLKNKVAIVTGASQGIGRGIAEKLAMAGSDVVVVHYDKDDSKALETVELLSSYGVRVACYRVNISDPLEVRKMLADTQEKFGKIDILVNNAGISSLGEIEELSYEQISAVLNVNLFGVFVMCKEVLPYLKQNNFGRIINISSTSMYTGGGGGAHYAASKSGLMGLMRNLSKSYGKYNITTNNLAISLIDTELFRARYPHEEDRNKAISGVPLKRPGTTSDVGYAVCFLASDWASYINGEIINVDGGRLYA